MNGQEMFERAIEYQRKRADTAEAELASLRQCSTCCGTPHPSGLPCICGGTNKAEDEVKGLRLKALRAGEDIATLRTKGQYIQARIESWERNFSGTVHTESLKALWSQIYAVLDVAWQPDAQDTVASLTGQVTSWKRKYTEAIKANGELYRHTSGASVDEPVEVSDEDFKPENVRRASMLSEEMLDALGGWRSLTDEERERFYKHDVRADKFFDIERLVMRLLKAAVTP